MESFIYLFFIEYLIYLTDDVKTFNFEFLDKVSYKNQRIFLQFLDVLDKSQRGFVCSLFVEIRMSVKLAILELWNIKSLFFTPLHLSHSYLLLCIDYKL